MSCSTDTRNQINSILANHKTRSAAERVALFEEVLDAVTLAAVTEHGTVEIEIRQRRHRVTDPNDFIPTLVNLITQYKRLAQAERYGRSRNHARIHDG